MKKSRSGAKVELQESGSEERSGAMSRKEPVTFRVAPNRYPSCVVRPCSSPCSRFWRCTWANVRPASAVRCFAMLYAGRSLNVVGCSVAEGRRPHSKGNVKTPRFEVHHGGN